MRKFIKNSRSRRIILITLVLIIFLLSVILYSNFIDYISILEKKETYASVNVADYIGFDVNATALKFGTISPGNSGSKKIYLENTYSYDVSIEIYVEGEIMKFLEVSDNNFILKKGDQKEVGFTVKIPKEAEYGTYEGKVVTIIKKTLK